MNNSLKRYAAGKGVCLWEVAERFGMSDSSFSRKLRKAFDTEQTEQFMKFVDEIVAERGCK